MQEMWVWSLGQEDPPEVGNGNPFQYSCLENPMDREASCGLQSQSRTQLSYWARTHIYTQ